MTTEELEELRDQKCERITELLEEKNVYILDDYAADVFYDENTQNEIFRVVSTRGLAIQPHLIDETLDEIISNLEAYQPSK